MRKVCFFLSAVIIVTLSPHWPARQASGFEDTSECRSLLDSKNYSRALSICTEAATKGNPAAQFNLSVMYHKGWGVSKNDEESLKWLRASADQRHPPAQYALSIRYANGDGVPRDTKEFLRLQMDAANQGFLLAQMILGKFYEFGYKPFEIERDFRMADNLYLKAAAQCDACQYELWRVHFFGHGFKKDPVKAAPYLKKAAHAGLPKAQMQLAFRYAEGEGVPKDNVQAYTWFYIADKMGDPIAKKALRPFSKKMTRSEINRAETMAKKIMGETTIDAKQLCAVYQKFCDK